MTRSGALRACGVAAAFVVGAACHTYDGSQVPVVSVGHGLRPQISWTAGPAYTLTVYRGEKDGDGVGAIWFASGGGGYENRLSPPVAYGVPPAGSEVASAPPLEAGTTYTVVVVRADERGGGDGFFNTRRRYAGMRTFVALE